MVSGTETSKLFESAIRGSVAGGRDWRQRIKNARYQVETNQITGALDTTMDIGSDYAEHLSEELRHAPRLLKRQFHEYDNRKVIGAAQSTELNDILTRLLTLLDKFWDILSNALGQPPAGGPETDENASASEGLRRIFAKNGVAAPRVSDLGSNGHAFDDVLVSIRNLTRRYGSSFALDPISFDLRAGEIIGIVGINGSGKSTLLNMIRGQTAKTGGTLEFPSLVEGRLRWNKIRSDVIAIDQRPPDWSGTVRQLLELTAATNGVTGADNRFRVDWVIARYGLFRYEHFRWKSLSGGYRLRVEIARALLSNPSVLVLDEPFANLDVVSIQRFLVDLIAIANARRSPVGILITSQHLYEVEVIADRLLILDDGKLLYDGELDELNEARRYMHVEFSNDFSADKMKAALSGLPLLRLQPTSITSIASFTGDLSFAAVLSVLAERGFVPEYVRDITHSTRVFFDPELRTDEHLDALAARHSASRMPEDKNEHPGVAFSAEKRR